VKNILFILFLMQVSLFLTGQENSKKNKEITLKISGKIVKDTTFRFINIENGKMVDPQKMNDFKDIRIENPYNTWNYWNGVIHIAFNRLSEELKDNSYRDISVGRYNFAFQKSEMFEKNYHGFNKWNYPFGQYLVTQELDDCGAMTAGLVDIYQYKKNPQYYKYMIKVADFMMNKNPRLKDGTFARPGPKNQTIWADDLYMSVPFLARMGHITDDSKYYDEAIKQVEKYAEYLMNPATNLYYHCWYSESEMNGAATWGRCNGWIMMAQVELLNFLPSDHPKRDRMVKLLLKQIVGVSRYQSQQGMWYQLLDKPDSYLETSATAMFIYSIARAVNQGWIDKSFLTIAENGWKGLQEKIDQEGNVGGICVGTSIEDNLVYYYNRPNEVNDIHGLGPIILAGIEMMKSE